LERYQALTSNNLADEPEAESHTVQWTVSPEEENVRIDRSIPDHVEEASRAQAKRWIEKGLVRVEGKTVRPSRLLRAGEKVEVDVPPPEPAEPEPEAIPLKILYEDDDLLVLDKPPDIIVHPAPGHVSGTLVNALLHHCPNLSGIGGVARPGIVHRLDRGTSGTLVVAKNDVTHRALAEQFASRTVEKRYIALVHGTAPEKLVLDRSIGRDMHNRKKISSRTRKGKTAATTAERLETLPLSSLLLVRIETGRTHQIRVHLSETGFPVVGDRDYGGARRPPRGGEKAFSILQRLNRPALHAAQLAFLHPRSGELVRYEAPLSPDIRDVLDELRTLAGQDAENKDVV
jgi:23S rRNA pseudouridine1911/1915/1917 synthase